MKKIIVLSAMSFIVQVLSAQDILITKDGDALKVWGIEVSNSAVFPD